MAKVLILKILPGIRPITSIIIHRNLLKYNRFSSCFLSEWMNLQCSGFVFEMP